MNPILWSPSPTAIASANLTRFREFARTLGGPTDDSYAALHRWSLADRGAFWTAVWRFCGVIGEIGSAGKSPTDAFQPGPHMTESTWFPESSLNFAENMLGPGEDPDSPAIVSRSETGARSILTRVDLAGQATAFAKFLREKGVQPGDRVAAVLPNIPEAIVAMLGTAAIGAIWSSCSPDFGDDAIVDRFGQIEPTVLVTTTESTYGGKRIAVADRVRGVLPRLPSVRTVVVAGDTALSPGRSPEWVRFAEAVADPPAGWEFPRFPFSHPLFVLYSSGTTGVPKCIVHGAGGTLLQLLKEHQLHSDIRPGDRVFYFTTTGWMMWNWLATVLASRATIVLFDGSPFFPDGHILWKIAVEEKLTHFGTSAKYLAHLEKQGVRPRESHDLSALRVLLSTGSPLLPEGFEYVYRDVKPDLDLASISGGTDIISCFALGCPTEPVRRGELQVAGLGMDLHVWNADGQAVVGEPGELVCTSPFPSMPVGFWNDSTREKYRGSYFGVFPNLWCHGDWAEQTATGGWIIYGRSDTTLNPGGVRIGTAEIYRQVETFPAVAESLATALRHDGDEQIVLFLRLKPGEELTPELVEAIRLRLKTRCSPRHVPGFVAAAPDFPRTVSGKLSEVAVRNAINGLPVKNTAALANPESLEFFQSWARERR